jgi:hypothetical protein
MTLEAENPSRKAEHFLRRLAAHHAAAFREFGEALEQFGHGEIGAGGVLKVAGDLYFRETGRFASALIGAVSEAWDSGFARTGREGRPAGAGDPANERTKAPTRHAK